MRSSVKKIGVMILVYAILWNSSAQAGRFGDAGQCADATLAQRVVISQPGVVAAFGIGYHDRLSAQTAGAVASPDDGYLDGALSGVQTGSITSRAAMPASGFLSFTFPRMVEIARAAVAVILIFSVTTLLSISAKARNAFGQQARALPSLSAVNNDVRGDFYEAVTGKKTIRIGINGAHPLFSRPVRGADGKVIDVNQDGKPDDYEGLEVNFIKIVCAVAGMKYELVPVTTKDRFGRLIGGDVDVLVRNVTATSTRETLFGVRFTAPLYIDGGGIIVNTRKYRTPPPAAEDDPNLPAQEEKAFFDFIQSSVGASAGVSVCVQPNTTQSDALEERLRARGIPPEKVIRHITNTDQIMPDLKNGNCDAASADGSQLFGGFLEESDPEFKKVLRILYFALSDDPLAPVTRNDPASASWHAFIEEVRNALLKMDELGVTAKNIRQFADAVAKGTEKRTTLVRYLSAKQDSYWWQVWNLPFGGAAFVAAVEKFGTHGDMMRMFVLQPLNRTSPGRNAPRGAGAGVLPTRPVGSSPSAEELDPRVLEDARQYWLQRLGEKSSHIKLPPVFPYQRQGIAVFQQSV
ncbi:MAG: transporter substrate-binding domain-containing protein [Candidatus Omnitrophica bacterium]|nr:transporter substrate-binding domain-containing protein [Candidatus Omnitrophota bacterium]